MFENRCQYGDKHVHDEGKFFDPKGPGSVTNSGMAGLRDKIYCPGCSSKIDLPTPILGRPASVTKYPGLKT